MREVAPGSVFAGHRIEAVAGRGGMGVVYRARQLSLDRVVALKVIAPTLTQDPAIRGRFLRESRVAASIDHPHVIPVYYTGEQDGVAYIAMRFVAGDDIRTLVRREGPPGPERAVRIVGQVAEALDAAHAAGLVHRDVKPANVLLAQGDHVYLTDFGLTKHVLSEPGAGGTREGHWVGTLDFVAPEQLRGERVDARSDIYALGCLLFYTLAGRPPFERDSDEAKLWAHLSEPPPKVSEAVPGAPGALDAVVARALAKTPDERYPSAGDLGRAAAAAVSGDRREQTEHVVAIGAAAPIEMETRTAGTWLASHTAAPRGRRLGWLAAAIAAVLAAAAGLLFALSGNPPRRNPTAATHPSASGAAPQIRSAFVGGRVSAVAGAGGHIWSGWSLNRRLKAVDAARVKRLKSLRSNVGRGLAGLTTDGETVWAIASRDRQLVHFDGRTGSRLGKPVPLPGVANAVAVDADSVFVAVTIQGQPGDVILQFDKRTGALQKTLVVLDMVRRVVVADAALWLLATHPARLVRVDLRTGRRDKWPLGSETSGDMAAGAGAIWITLPAINQVTRLPFKDPGNPATIGVGPDPAGVVVAGDDVWVANKASSTLTRIGLRSLRARPQEIDVPINPYELAAYRGSVWVTSLVKGLVTRVTAPPRR